MAKTAKPNGQQARGASSPTRTGGPRATTSKQAGVRSRRRSVRDAVVRANATNARRRVRQFATDDALHDLLTNLPAKRMPADLVRDTSKAGAQRRRAWCVANGATVVRVYDDGISARRACYAPANVNGFRPENALRERLLSLAGIGVDGFGYTRCDTNWNQYQQVLALDWTDYDPDQFTYEGADSVFLYRV